MIFRALKRFAGRDGASAAAQNDWLADAFRAEELAGHGLATAMRTVALVAIAVLLLYIVEAPWHGSLPCQAPAKMEGPLRWAANPKVRSTA